MYDNFKLIFKVGEVDHVANSYFEFERNYSKGDKPLNLNAILSICECKGYKKRGEILVLCQDFFSGKIFKYDNYQNKWYEVGNLEGI